jgi:flagellar export protein FliJ
MKQRARLEPVHDIAESAERSCAARLAGMEQRLREAQHREQELRCYAAEYQSALDARMQTGATVQSLRDYQVFLARLGAATTAQHGLCVQLTAECEQERQQLLAAIQRRQVLGKVIAKVHQEEQRMKERQQQHEHDDNASAQRART